MKKQKTKRTIKTRKENILKDCLNFIWSSRIFIMIVLIFFTLFLLLGLFYPVFLTNELTDLIKELIGKTEGLNFQQLFAFIFYNNLKTSLFGVLFGLFLGIPPVFFAILNGYLLGFVLNITVNANGLGDVWKLFPHGIFELPAFFISLGIGLRLGHTLLFKTKNLKQDFLISLKTFFYIILPLLLVAGLIETSLIFWLK